MCACIHDLGVHICSPPPALQEEGELEVVEGYSSCHHTRTVLSDYPRAAPLTAWSSNCPPGGTSRQIMQFFRDTRNPLLVPFLDKLQAVLPSTPLVPAPTECALPWDASSA